MSEPRTIPAGRPQVRPRFLFRACRTLPGVGRAASPQLRPFSAEVRVLPLNGCLGTVLGHAREVAHQGLFVYSRTTLPVGTLVLLQVTCELGRARFTARVVQAVRRLGLGCKFVDVDDRQREALSRMVAAASSAPEDARTLDGSPPRRRSLASQ